MRHKKKNNAVNIVGILQLKRPETREPLKITKRTHFPVTEINI